MSEFDWVTARAKCSIGQVFDQLRLDVKSDLQKREAIRRQDVAGGGYTYAFTFTANEDAFTVSLRGGFGTHSITFALEGYAIAVRNEKEKELFRATITLNNAGRCIAKIGEQEIELWQLRHKALESLFFEMGAPFNIPA